MGFAPGVRDLSAEGPPQQEVPWTNQRLNSTGQTLPQVVTRNLLIPGGSINYSESLANPLGAIPAFDVHAGRLVWNWDRGFRMRVESAVMTRSGDVEPVDAHRQHGAPDFSFARRRLLQAVLAWPALSMLTACADRSNGTTPSAELPAFLTTDERLFLDAATARLIPDGNDGLGARAAQVPYFIERQLFGPYGRAATWYMQGPFAEGTEQQGYQVPATPAQLYRIAIHDVDAYCKETYSGKAFAALSDEQQDAVLHGLENDDIKLAKAPAKPFFDMLWKNTQEGFLADPMYGGNRNFIGWRLIGFPGPRYNYLNEITQYGQPYKLPPVGLLGRDGSLVQGVRI